MNPKHEKMKSLQLLKENEFSKEEDEKIALAISYILWKREQEENK